MRYLTLLYFLVICSLVQANIPNLKGRVNDYAQVLSSSESQQLEASLASLEKTTGVQIAILTVGSTQPDVIEEYSIRVVEDWKLGQKDKDNGVLLLAAIKDRKFRIEVGYGLEGVFTDAYCKMLIVNDIGPAFKQGQYFSGLNVVVNKMSKAAKGEYSAEAQLQDAPVATSNRNTRGKSIIGVIVLVLFGLSFARAIKSKPLKVILAIVFGVIVFVVTSKIVLTAVLSFIAFLMLFGRGNGGGGTGYYGGGYYGSRGGGSSFGGGFSGGGGSFGGGGASGDW